MASGSSGKSSSSAETSPIGTLSFVPALLANAFFGTGIGTSDGGFEIVGPDELFNPDGTKNTQAFFDDLAGSLIVPPGQPTFNPGGLISNLPDLANPNINPAVGNALSFLGTGLQGGGLAALANQGAVLPNLLEGLQTGFKPDIQPVIDAATRGFFGQIVPQLGQQNVALNEGVGPFSTDLSRQLLTAGADIATDLGALETQLQSQAGQVRADLTGIAPVLLESLFAAPFRTGSSALDLGEQLVLTGTPGGRQAQLLQLLTGNVPAGTGVGRGQSSQGSSKQASGGIL